MADEKNFENKFKRWLESQGIYRLGTPQQNMKVKPCGYYEKRHGSMYTGSGLPDMHIVINGVSLEVELKAHNGRLSEHQRQKINQIRQAGCMALVAKPSDFDALKNHIERMKECQKCIRNMDILP